LLANDALKLMKKHAKCPDCGSEFISNGEGSLVIENDIFIRTCKCGYSYKTTSAEVNEKGAK
jgi:Zn ribbon nucleic-acid-binding protein